MSESMKQTAGVIILSMLGIAALAAMVLDIGWWSLLVLGICGLVVLALSWVDPSIRMRQR